MAIENPDKSKGGRSDDKKLPFVEKRKYRKHPKPDQNAPEKPPPSAYHLFAREQGDILRKEGYNFQGVARQTGAMWRELSPHDTSHLESRTVQAKIKYKKDLEIYKTSADHRAYQEYLKQWSARDETKKRRVKKRSSQSSSLSTSPSPASNATTSSTANNRVDSPLSPRVPSAMTIAELPGRGSCLTSVTTDEPLLDRSRSVSASSPTHSASTLLTPKPLVPTNSLGLHLSSPASATTVPSSDCLLIPPSSKTSTLPELPTTEQPEWKWTGNYDVTLAPDLLFQVVHKQPPNHERWHDHSHGYHSQHYNPQSSLDLDEMIDSYPINTNNDDMDFDGSGLGSMLYLPPFWTSTISPEMLAFAALESIVNE